MREASSREAIANTREVWLDPRPATWGKTNQIQCARLASSPELVDRRWVRGLLRLHEPLEVVRRRAHPAVTRTVFPSGSSTRHILGVEVGPERRAAAVVAGIDQLGIRRVHRGRSPSTKNSSIVRAPPLGGTQSGSFRTNVVVMTS